MAARWLGIIERAPTSFGLATAARQLPGVEVRDLDPPEAHPDVDAIVIDAALEEREVLLMSVATTVIPVIVEMPAAATADGVERLESALSGSPVVSINPLAHHLHTRRLLELVRDEPDPVTAIFAAWRFRPGDVQPDALAQLLDYVARISTEPLLRIAAMRRESPDVLLATIRYEDGVVAHIECGAHLPPSFDAPSELTVEIFRRESVLHSDAFRQALTVQGETTRSVDWAPSAAVAALQESLATTGDTPLRGLAEDHANLTVLDAIEWSARQGTVARW